MNHLEVIEEHSPALYWDSTYAIAIALIGNFPDLAPEDVGLNQLSDLVLSLPNFQDFPELINERILLDVQIAWYEELASL